MTTTLAASLYRAAAATFEELGFFFPDEELTAAQQAAEPAAAVVVGFTGEQDGTLIVRICGDVLPGLAANMLGQDEMPELRVQQDALGEVANVICGNVLPSLAGARAAFELDAPRVVAPELEHGVFPLHLGTCVQLGLDDGRADVWLVTGERIGA